MTKRFLYVAQPANVVMQQGIKDQIRNGTMYQRYGIHTLDTDTVNTAQILAKLETLRAEKRKIFSLIALNMKKKEDEQSKTLAETPVAFVNTVPQPYFAEHQNYPQPEQYPPSGLLPVSPAQAAQDHYRTSSTSRSDRFPDQYRSNHVSESSRSNDYRGEHRGEQTDPYPKRASMNFMQPRQWGPRPPHTRPPPPRYEDYRLSAVFTFYIA